MTMICETRSVNTVPRALGFLLFNYSCWELAPSRCRVSAVKGNGNDVTSWDLCLAVPLSGPRGNLVTSTMMLRTSVRGLGSLMIMMISHIWWYADIDRNLDVMVERYQMILDMCDTDIDTDWSDRDAVVAVCIISDIRYGGGNGL